MKETLVLRARKESAAVPSWMMGALVAGVFIAVTGMGMLAGAWHNAVSKEEYLFRFQRLDSPLYHHAQGSVPAYGPND